LGLLAQFTGYSGGNKIRSTAAGVGLNAAILTRLSPLPARLSRLLGFPGSIGALPAFVGFFGLTGTGKSSRKASGPSSGTLGRSGGTVGVLSGAFEDSIGIFEATGLDLYGT